MSNRNTISPAVFAIVLLVVALVTHCAARANPVLDELLRANPPPVTKREQQFNEAMGVAAQTPPDCIRCVNIRQHGNAAACITVAEWERQQGTKAPHVMPTVAWYGCAP